MENRTEFLAFSHDLCRMADAGLKSAGKRSHVGPCRVVGTAERFIPIGQPGVIAVAKKICGSVGIKGQNAVADVMAVQGLLNRARGGLGGPLQPIGVDGVVGPETVGAIVRFQSQNFGWSDGRVDSDGQTLARLNAVVDQPATAASAASSSKTSGGMKFAPPQSGGFNASAGVGPSVESAGTKGAAWALITSVSGKVKMRFPGSGWLQAFPGFFLPPGGVLMTYDGAGAPLTLPLTPEEFNSPYPWEPGAASVQMSDGSKRSIGPFTLFVVS